MSNSVKNLFFDVLDDACKFIEKQFANQAEKEKFIADAWDDYGDDIEEYIDGACTEKEWIAMNALSRSKLMAEAIKANSESIFGWNITEYCEN